MDKTILVTLAGHDDQYRLEPDAFDRLARYLDGAAERLQDDPDRADVLGDLERSIGDKLVRTDPGDRPITIAAIDAVLDAIGAVDTGRADEAAAAAAAATQPRRRRLVRVRDGQQMAGVCNGLAAYSEIRVDWVRTIFILATVATAGVFLIVYVAMAFILPVVETPAEARAGRSRGPIR